MDKRGLPVVEADGRLTEEAPDTGFTAPRCQPGRWGVPPTLVEPYGPFIRRMRALTGDGRE